MLIRERMEERERRILSPLAVKSAESRGREVPERECDVRTCFQRDRDRIMYSKAFRRLKHKTQVFISPEGDHYRTRLTHTLEVAQIARTTARALLLNEDLTEAIGFGHDLGHAPFGHAGEEALDEVIKEYAPDQGFKHHIQSLRVVEELEGAGGLNPTWEVRDGISHHTKGRDNLEMNTDYLPSTLEGEVVRISDRLAYLNHDIDDAIRGGILREEDLPDCIVRLGENVSQRVNAMVRDIIENSWERPRIALSPEMLALTEEIKEYLFDAVYLNSQAKKEEEKAKSLVRNLFRFYMERFESFFPQAHEETTAQKARHVCDYIAGMTDRFAISRFGRLFVPKVWKLEDEAQSVEDFEAQGRPGRG
ncbi:MAG: deoxyguanosinetriphosphate triphosphohydrolase [Armatimonadetes bacterium]|nr:deoxyguanosinetriphosphate triphosphohydrolase [Armatimonadota bacterium]